MTSTYLELMLRESIMHYGILGMHWGYRRYQNADGSLTPLGRSHYGVGPPRSNTNRPFLRIWLNGSKRKKKSSNAGASGQVTRQPLTEEQKKALIHRANPAEAKAYISELSTQELIDFVNRARKINDIDDLFNTQISKAQAAKKRQEASSTVNRLMSSMQNLTNMYTSFQKERKWIDQEINKFKRADTDKSPAGIFANANLYTTEELLAIAKRVKALNVIKGVIPTAP